MATMFPYQLPVNETGWRLDGQTQTSVTDMGAIEFAEVDSDAMLEQDQRVAEEFDAKAFVNRSLR